MPCEQGTGLGCPVALLAGFASKGVVLTLILTDIYVTLIIEIGHLMKLLLTRSESIDLTIIMTLPARFHSWLLLVVRLGGYIANLSDFYSCRLIGKLTDFLQLQEFSLRNLTVDSSTTSARLFLLCLSHV